jgi:hypothetical protein
MFKLTKQSLLSKRVCRATGLHIKSTSTFNLKHMYKRVIVMEYQLTHMNKKNIPDSINQAKHSSLKHCMQL